MQQLMKSDVFFMVTTVAVVVITLCIVVALVYLIRILRDASAVSKVVRKEGEDILKDVGEVRGVLKNQTLGVVTVVGDLIRSFLPRGKKHKGK